MAANFNIYQTCFCAAVLIDLRDKAGDGGLDDGDAVRGRPRPRRAGSRYGSRYGSTQNARWATRDGVELQQRHRKEAALSVAQLQQPSAYDGIARLV